MEYQEFDQLARESAGASTRRALVRSLAAMLGVAGVGLAVEGEGEARRRKAKRQHRRKSKKREKHRRKKQHKREKKREKKEEARQECNENKPCPASTNPCKVTACESNVCVTSNVANGTSCGTDMVCSAGQCVELECSNTKPCTPSTNPCQTVACQNNTCVTSNLADGTDCGGNHVCSSGICVCPSGETCDVMVTPSSLNGWVGYDDRPGAEKIDNSILHFRSGPGTPIYGSGSVELDSPGDERYNVATFQYAGIKLSDLTELSFTLYTPTEGNDGTNTAYLQFNVSFDGSDEWQSRLRYTPKENGTVVYDKWDEWDAIDDGEANWRWTGTGNWPTPAGGGTAVARSQPKTWAKLLTDYPDIMIHPTNGFLGIRDGQTNTEQNTADIGSVTIATADGGTRFVFGPDS